MTFFELEIIWWTFFSSENFAWYGFFYHRVLNFMSNSCIRSVSKTCERESSVLCGCTMRNELSWFF